MALNFQQFQNRGGGAQGNIGSVLSAVAAGMPSKAENLGLQVEDSIQSSMKGLEELWVKGFSGMKDMNNFMDSYHFPSSIESWNHLTSGWGKREKLAAARAGINLLSYTQAFNQSKAQYLSGIENNIKNHQSMNKLSDAAMRNEFEGMRNVAAFVNKNTTDPVINNLVTPNRGWTDQIEGFGKAIVPFPGLFGMEQDTLGQGAAKAGTLLTLPMWGPKVAQGARYLGGKYSEFLGLGGGGTSSKGIIQTAKNLFKGSTPVTSGPAGQQLNLFPQGGAPTKKGILKSLTQKLGKSRALSLLAKLPKNPYLIAAALLGMGIYSLSKNKGSYQGSIDKRLEDTYGGGTPDYTGGNPQEAFAKAMAEYKSKYGLK